MGAASTPPEANPRQHRTPMTEPGLKTVRLTAAYTIVGLALATVLSIKFVRNGGLSPYFFQSQDLVGMILAGLVLMFLPAAERLGGPLRRWIAQMSMRPAVTVAGLAVGAVLIGGLGWWVVFGGHALSDDEFMALFDAEIFRHGALIAPLPSRFRPIEMAMQPLFQIALKSGAGWSSSYYPVNAMILAVLDVFGLRAAAGGLMSALSLVMVYRLAGRLWPDARHAGLVAALLLASSSQLLVAAMTPYAMSAHLALNLLWLNLFLGRGWVSQGLALVVAAAATGLHQLVFHPLFAAPFVLQLWLDRQWARAVFHSLGYLALAALWPHYWDLALWSAHLDGARATAVVLDPSRIALAQLQQLGPEAFEWQLENLSRFVSWQNPLAFGLFLVGAPLAFRAGGVERSLVLGLALTFALVSVIIPYQGHGWGYRYLHGLLGSFVLIAVRGAMAIWPTASGGLGRRALMPVMVAALICWAVLVPLCMVQAWVWSAPYARADAYLRHVPADVVLVNSHEMAFGDDLVRNDPWLRTRPVIVSALTLTPTLMEQTCALGRVAVFDRAAADAFHIPIVEPGKLEPRIAGRIAALRRLQSAGRCGVTLRPDPAAQAPR